MANDMISEAANKTGKYIAFLFSIGASFILTSIVFGLYLIATQSIVSWFTGVMFLIANLLVTTTFYLGIRLNE